MYHRRYFIQAIEIALMGSVPFKRTNFVFPNRLDRRIYETKFPTAPILLSFFFSIPRITCHFLSTLRTFLLFVTVALLFYQSPFTQE
jgi:hypothetical protein